MKLYRRRIPTPRYALINVNSKGMATIILRVSFNKKRVGFSTGIRIPKKYWDKNRQRMKLIRGKEDEYKDINRRLDGFSDLAQDIIAKHQAPPITPDQFKTLMADLSGKTEIENPSTLFPFIRDFIERKKEDPTLKYNTFKKFPVSFAHLQNFAADMGRNDFSFEEIDWDFRDRYLNWLYSPPREHSQNTAKKEISNLRTFMNDAKRRGFHNNTTCNEKGFNITPKKVRNKVRLTFEELEAMANLDLSNTPRLERVRDLFLVGCYTGTRESDWSKVNRENINEISGGYFIEIMTKKIDGGTGRVIIPVFPILKNILEKYNYELPELAQQNINEYIKEVCELVLPNKKFHRIYSKGGRIHSEMALIHKHISTHAARRSFASNFWESGVCSTADLMQITAHKTEKQFFEYIDISQEAAAKRFAKTGLEALNKRNK